MKHLALVLALAVAAFGLDPFDPGTAALFEIDLDSLKFSAGAAYGAGDYAGAAALYLEALQYDIRSSGDIYNLACCYGLLGRDTLAATYLQLSVQAGFSDIGWAAADPDFERVRPSLYFSSAFDSLASRVASRESEAGLLAFVTSGVMVPCRIHAPLDLDTSGPVDLVIGLHGYGGNARSFAGLWSRFQSPDFVYVVPEAPYPMSGGQEIGYSWSTGSPTDPLAEPASWQLSSGLVRSVIEQMRGRFEVGDIYLLGFSQGCSLAYTAGFSNSDLVTGIICFAGFLDPGTLPAGSLGRSGGPRVFIAHGTNDRVVDPAASAAARDTLTALGYDVTFRSFEGGHRVTDSVLVEALDWMRE